MRIYRHKVFQDVAKRGRTSADWFFGLKLHIVINNQEDIMNFTLTEGNGDDRAVVEHLVDKLQGWLFGDRGYISKKLAQSLANKGLELIAKIKTNMKELDYSLLGYNIVDIDPIN